MPYISDYQLNFETIFIYDTLTRNRIHLVNIILCSTNLIIEWLVGGFDNLCLPCLIVYIHTNHRTDISSSQLTTFYNPHSNLINKKKCYCSACHKLCNQYCLHNSLPVLGIWLVGKHCKEQRSSFN